MESPKNEILGMWTSAMFLGLWVLRRSLITQKHSGAICQDQYLGLKANLLFNYGALALLLQCQSRKNKHMAREKTECTCGENNIFLPSFTIISVLIKLCPSHKMHLDNHSENNLGFVYNSEHVFAFWKLSFSKKSSGLEALTISLELLWYKIIEHRGRVTLGRTSRISRLWSWVHLAPWTPHGLTLPGNYSHLYSERLTTWPFRILFPGRKVTLVHQKNVQISLILPLTDNNSWFSPVLYFFCVS